MLFHKAPASVTQPKSTNARIACAPRPVLTRGPCSGTLQAPRRLEGVTAHAQSGPDFSPRPVISGIATAIYKTIGLLTPVPPEMSPLWTSLLKLDSAGVSLLKGKADANERGPNGDTPLLFVAREGHYKYPPNEIPQMLIDMGGSLEAKDANGHTPLQVALLSGWQNIAELLISSGADTSGPDCKRLIAKYNLA